MELGANVVGDGGLLWDMRRAANERRRGKVNEKKKERVDECKEGANEGAGNITSFRSRRRNPF